MLPKGFEWVVIIVLALINYVLPIVLIAVLVVFLVRRFSKRDAARANVVPEAPAAPAAPVVPASNQAQADAAPASSDEERIRIDRLLAEHNLTDRERDILIGVYRGKTQAQLADEMYLSRSTVGTYCTRAYEKLGVATKEDALELLRRTASEE